MENEQKNHLDDALNRAKRVKTDAGEVEKTSVYEAIAYDKYRRQTESATKSSNPFAGMKFGKISPDGC